MSNHQHTLAKFDALLRSSVNWSDQKFRDTVVVSVLKVLCHRMLVIADGLTVCQMSDIASDVVVKEDAVAWMLRISEEFSAQVCYTLV